jgi:hypothetical protein
MDASLSVTSQSQEPYIWFLPFLSRKVVDMIIVPCAAVMGSEILIDWLKHAFITKFNHIRGTVYSKYVDILCKDLVGDAPGELSDRKKKVNRILFKYLNLNPGTLTEVRRSFISCR